MKRIFRRLLPFLLVSLFAVDAQCADSRPLIIGQAIDLSGPNGDFGRDFSLGAKIYFDYANQNGGIQGRKLVFLSRDSAGQPEQGRQVAKKLAGEGAQILFGLTGDSTVEAVAKDPAVKQSGLPIFGAVTGNTRLTPQDGVFYLRAGVAEEIAATVRQLAPLGIKTISLASTAEFAEEANKSLKEAAAHHNVRILAQQPLDIHGDGPQRAAQALAQGQPQAVLVVADTLTVAQFFKRYRQLDQGSFLCATSQVNVRTLTSILGPQAARGLIISQVVPDPAAYSDLTREHKKLLEKQADEPASHATLEGFMAAKALVHTLRQSKETSTAAIRQAWTKDGRLDLGGYQLELGKSARASRFVELTVVGRDGRLLR